MSWWKGTSNVSLLSECCICRASGFVAFPAAQTLCPGEFAGLDDHTLTLALFPEDEGFLTDCLCCVTFNHKHRPHVFLSSVRSVDQDVPGDPLRLSLEIPEQILVDKRRIAFRVPVTDDSQLKVWVKTPDGQTWMPATRNLSVAGMLIEFDPDAAPRLAPGDSIEVFLQLPDNEIRLQANVMRSAGDSYGLSFPGSIRGGMLEPPPALEAIVRAIDQRRWPTYSAAGQHAY